MSAGRKGKSWLYYIVAVCQWLPTNYRTNYNRDMQLKCCNLCLGNCLDTMDHLLRCPALAKEQIHLKDSVVSKFDFWDIPYASIPQKPRELMLRAHWRSSARHQYPATVISDFRLDLLTKGFIRQIVRNILLPHGLLLKVCLKYCPFLGRQIISSAQTFYRY